MTGLVGGSAAVSGPAVGGRARRVAVAGLLILAGLSVGVIAAATPSYGVGLLEPSGTFFALALTGDTVYAASDNGGAILLEKSVDRGATWAASPVPYSAIAGGAPWTYAAVAADGSNVLLTAATGGGFTGVYPAAAVASNASCYAPSTLLVATSEDGGRSWATATTTVLAFQVDTLTAAVDGATEAVVWAGTAIGCGSSAISVGATVSSTAGSAWTSPSYLNATNASVSSPAVELAPSDRGLVAAYTAYLPGGTVPQLLLATFNASVATTFVPATSLVAPASWTLQGDPGSPAILVTPAYLVVLDRAPYAALPFDQLSSDAPSLGALPRVVSLVPTGSDELSVTATTSDDLGVDCWSVDTVTGAVAQTCHVPLGNLIAPNGGARPIVALLGAGAWWVAVGAATPSCPPVCPPYGPVYPPVSGGPSPAPPASAGGSAAVGTSVCQTGCSAVGGIAAYTFDSGASGAGVVGDVVGAGLVLLGIVLALTGRSRRALPPSPADPDRTDLLARLPQLRRRFRRGLLVWALVWSPFAALLFVPSAAAEMALAPVLAVVLGILGLLLALAFHGVVRRGAQRADGWSPEGLARAFADELGPNVVPVELAAIADYLSWGLMAALGLVLLFGAGSTAPSVGGLAVGLIAGIAAARGASYGLLGWALLSAEARGSGRSTPLGPRARTAIGSALFPWSPLAGLVLGIAASTFAPVPSLLLMWAFLPVTLAGLAVLGGAFGSTAWTEPDPAGTLGLVPPPPAAPA